MAKRNVYYGRTATYGVLQAPNLSATQRIWLFHALHRNLPKGVMYAPADICEVIGMGVETENPDGDMEFFPNVGDYKRIRRRLYEQGRLLKAGITHEQEQEVIKEAKRKGIKLPGGARPWSAVIPKMSTGGMEILARWSPQAMIVHPDEYADARAALVAEQEANRTAGQKWPTVFVLTQKEDWMQRAPLWDLLDKFFRQPALAFLSAKGDQRAEKFWKSILNTVPKAPHPGLRAIENKDFACQVALIMVAGKLYRKGQADLGDKENAAAYLSTCIMSLGDRPEDRNSIRNLPALEEDYVKMEEHFWTVEEVWKDKNLEGHEEVEAVAG